MTNLDIGATDFAKISKRLHKQLKEKQDLGALELKPLTLTQTQEELAKSFGFRNYNGLHTYFQKIETGQPPSLPKNSAKPPKFQFLDVLTQEQFIVLIRDFLTLNSPQLELSKVVALAEAVLPVFYELRKHNAALTLHDLKKNFEIRDLLNIYKTFSLPHDILEILKSYFASVHMSSHESTVEASDSDLFRNRLLRYELEPIFKVLLKLESESIIICPQYHVEQIQLIHEYSYISDILSPLKEWDNYSNANFFNDDIFRLIRRNKSKLKDKDLFLHDLMALPLNYLEEAQRFAIYKLFYEYYRSFNLTKSYSQEMLTFLKEQKQS